MFNRTVNRRLALGCVAGPAVFTLAWAVLGFLSPGYHIHGAWIDSYDPAAQPISGLGLGVTGPYMNTGFILGGLLIVLGVAGVFGVVAADDPGHRPAAARTAAVLLALSGVGLVVAGVFTLEHAGPHLLGFSVAAGMPVVAFPVAGRYLRGIPARRRFGTWLVAAGPLTLLLVIAYAVSFDQEQAGANQGVAGLTSRLLALFVHVNIAALGVHAVRGSRRTEPAIRQAVAG